MNYWYYLVRFGTVITVITAGAKSFNQPIYGKLTSGLGETHIHIQTLAILMIESLAEESGDATR